MSILTDQRIIPAAARFPANPYQGQTIVDNAPGRVWQYTWNGTLWEATRAYGPATLYVSTTGTDDLDHGTGPGAAAFRTVQFARNNIPYVFSGQQTINVGQGNFLENVNCPAMFQFVNSNVFFVGATSNITNIVATGGTIGGAAGAVATVTGGPWVAGAYDHKLIHFTSGANNDIYRIIGRTEAGTLRILGVPLNAAPVNGDTAEILDFATVIRSIYVGMNNADNMRFIHFDGLGVTAPNAPFYAFKTYAFYRYCQLDQTGLTRYGVLADDAHVVIFDSYLRTTVNGAYTCAASSYDGNLDIVGCQIQGFAKAPGSGWGVEAFQTAYADVLQSDVYNHNVGILAWRGGSIETNCAGVFNFIHGNNTYGIQVAHVSHVNGTGAGHNIYGKQLDGATVDTNGVGDHVADALTFSTEIA